jgi:hypothetical protein
MQYRRESLAGRTYHRAPDAQDAAHQDPALANQPHQSNARVAGNGIAFGLWCLWFLKSGS